MFWPMKGADAGDFWCMLFREVSFSSFPFLGTVGMFFYLNKSPSIFPEENGATEAFNKYLL